MGRYIQFSLVAVLLTSLATIPVYNHAFAQSVPSTVTIAGTCGLAFPPPGTLAYGPLGIGGISPEILLSATNTGTVTADYTVEGTDWIATTDYFLGPVPIFSLITPVMAVDETAYEIYVGPPPPVPPGTPIASKTALTLAPLPFAFGVPPGATVDSYWQLEVFLSVPEFDGDAAQTVTFTGSC